MPRESVDVLISGGGVAGLAAAAGFGAAGFSVLCVDPTPPVTDAAQEGADLRTTAFLQPARALFDDIGLWPRLALHATALQVMRIVETGGEVAEPRRIHDFDASEISDEPFGWNLPNWLLRREMLAHLDGVANVAFRPGTATTGLITREDAALVRLSDGGGVRARLLVAADGRDSPMREVLGIGAHTLRYGQRALAFAVTHPLAHDNVSTEIHREGGPFTLVPLPDRNGQPCSAVVWMERGPQARRLAALPAPEFERAMSERSAWLFGPLSLASPITQWPIISRIADRFTGQRSALIAEAAHVVPPIGAQGLNMSLADLATLLELGRDDPAGLGGEAMLTRYQRRRWSEACARVGAIDLLNRSSMAGWPVAQSIRAMGLDLLHSAPALRRAAMHAGLGAQRMSG